MKPVNHRNPTKWKFYIPIPNKQIDHRLLTQILMLLSVLRPKSSSIFCDKFYSDTEKRSYFRSSIVNKLITINKNIDHCKSITTI